MTLEQILKRAADRNLVPTELSSAEIRDNIAADVRRRALFIARGTNLQFLAKLAEVLDLYLAGKVNDATARLMLQQELEAIGYTPEGGFPDADPGAVPPAERGSIRDISSAKRLQLILDTQAQLAFGEGQKMAGESTQRAFDYPAWELIRISPREVPRGYKRTVAGLVAVPQEAWPARFIKAGGALVAGRMIALKGSEVWAALGSARLFDDALDTDHPPFAFQSGVGWKAVPRRECLDLGVIDNAHKPEGFSDWRIKERAKIGVSKIPRDLLVAAQKELGAKLEGRTLRQLDRRKAAREAYEARSRRTFSRK